MRSALSPKPTNPELETVYRPQNVIVDHDLPSVVRRIIRLFDGHRTAAVVLRDARISEGVGLAVIRKLTQTDIIEPVSTLECADTLRDLPSLRKQQSQLAEKGFSSEEEAFFASDVQPEDELNQPSFRERLSLLWTDYVIDWA